MRDRPLARPGLRDGARRARGMSEVRARPATCGGPRRTSSTARRSTGSARAALRTRLQSARRRVARSIGAGVYRAARELWPRRLLRERAPAGASFGSKGRRFKCENGANTSSAADASSAAQLDGVTQRRWTRGRRAARRGGCGGGDVPAAPASLPTGVGRRRRLQLDAVQLREGLRSALARDVGAVGAVHPPPVDRLARGVQGGVEAVRARRRLARSPMQVVDKRGACRTGDVVPYSPRWCGEGRGEGGGSPCRMSCVEPYVS